MFAYHVPHVCHSFRPTRTSPLLIDCAPPFLSLSDCAFPPFLSLSCYLSCWPHLSTPVGDLLHFFKKSHDMMRLAQSWPVPSVLHLSHSVPQFMNPQGSKLCCASFLSLVLTWGEEGLQGSGPSEKRTV